MKTSSLGTRRYLVPALLVVLAAASWRASAAESGASAPAALPVLDQPYPQEIGRRHAGGEGWNGARAQLVVPTGNGGARAFSEGRWYAYRDGAWQRLPEYDCRSENEFVFPDVDGRPVRVALPWAEVFQWVRDGDTTWLATRKDPYKVVRGELSSVGWPSRWQVRQIAVAPDGTLWVASSDGLVRQRPDGWGMVGIADGRGRGWAVNDVRGVAFDARQRLWIAVPAGVITGDGTNWTFYEGRDGVPYTDFTWVTAGADGSVWFGTKIGAVRFDGKEWTYRQGLRWLPGDDVRNIAVEPDGTAWFATSGGVGSIERRPMTLAAKAAHYEDEVERYIKRTPFGYTSEVNLPAPGDRSKIEYSDSDNDGLWTAMYGAGECFAYAATKRPEFKARAKQAFEALRFLQKVTQGGPHSPPKGYVARTIRPVEWPDPNVGRLEDDKRTRENGDRLWKVYEPRWPKSADGKWYWKSDTSSDELDGHYFFYARYYDLVADDAEKERVREVVRDLTDHLVSHDFCLIDHDGTPTRWGVFGPKYLNDDPRWWLERGLNSLSILSYLAVAEHMTGEARFAEASRQLVEQHGYGSNVMNPKAQTGFGSGNQSDDEMGFMCFYNLLSYTKETRWRGRWLYAFHAYSMLEQPEMNPFFNFAHAVHARGKTYGNPWGDFSLDPWAGWLDDSLRTLRGFPLDRVNWAQRNGHRADLVALTPQQSVDIYEPRTLNRGYRVNGKVLPVEERHFNHWNTDPWHLNYGGNGRELASGTVFLLPYYMGLYHGFIAAAPAATANPASGNAASASNGTPAAAGAAGAAGWVSMNDVKFEASGTGLRIGKGAGWVRSDREYGDFVFEAEVRPDEERYDSGLIIRAGLDGKPWPTEGWQVNLRRDMWGALVKGFSRQIASTIEGPDVDGETWSKFRLEVRGTTARLDIDGKKVWETDKIDRPRGYVGFQVEGRAFEFRNVQVRELR